MSHHETHNIQTLQDELNLGCIEIGLFIRYIQ